MNYLCFSGCTEISLQAVPLSLQLYDWPLGNLLWFLAEVEEGKFLVWCLHFTPLASGHGCDFIGVIFTVSWSSLMAVTLNAFHTIFSTNQTLVQLCLKTIFIFLFGLT